MSRGKKPDRPTQRGRRALLIGIPAAETGLVYNGTELTGVPAGEGYTITGNTGTTSIVHNFDGKVSGPATMTMTGGR